MDSLTSEVELSDEALSILETTHRFAADVLRPAGKELDELPDPADVIAPDSVLWTVHEKYRQLGVHQLGELGLFEPAELSLLLALINEEMGWGDSGLAVSLGAAGFPRNLAPLTGDQELLDRYFGPDSTSIGCWAITEPDHGSDNLTLTDPSFADSGIRANCIARRDGDDYVINGTKAAWVSNGTIADVAALFCSIDGDGGFAKGGVAIVPLDGPGVSRGRPLDKLGQRALPQGEIHFDNVRIPGRWMVVEPEAYAPMVEAVLTSANTYMGTTFVGLARAAYEHALEYARERVQGGRPIVEHATVQTRLFKMFARLEASRSLARRVAVMGASGSMPIQYAIASKTFCTNTAFDIASDALQILGGNGLAREYPIEKLLRDARAAMIEDGCNEVLSIVAGSKL
ncbi:MAG: acyl-CoA/acyl-ACP dehydrogenase [Actinomycetia bacterium]|nr:acyl-CoA/acyl-ACP dehydrogenase [Actinomycetes bacterium]